MDLHVGDKIWFVNSTSYKATSLMDYNRHEFQYGESALFGGFGHTDIGGERIDTILAAPAGGNPKDPKQTFDVPVAMFSNVDPNATRPEETQPSSQPQLDEAPHATDENYVLAPPGQGDQGGGGQVTPEAKEAPKSGFSPIAIVAAIATVGILWYLFAKQGKK